MHVFRCIALVSIAIETKTLNCVLKAILGLCTVTQGAN